MNSYGGGGTGYVERLFSLIRLGVQFSPLAPLAPKQNLSRCGPEGGRKDELSTSNHLVLSQTPVHALSFSNPCAFASTAPSAQKALFLPTC